MRNCLQTLKFLKDSIPTEYNSRREFYFLHRYCSDGAGFYQVLLILLFYRGIAPLELIVFLSTSSFYKGFAQPEQNIPHKKR